MSLTDNYLNKSLINDGVAFQTPIEISNEPLFKLHSICLLSLFKYVGHRAHQVIEVEILLRRDWLELQKVLLTLVIIIDTLAVLVNQQ